MTTLTPDAILSDAEASMDKAFEYLRSELRGIRTGRASTALVEYVKIDYYGSMTDLKALAAISVPDATHIVVQPFDPGSVNDIKKGLEAADLGLNPQVDGKILRIAIPPLSGDRRQQLVTQVKKLGEESKIAVRNIRRDANKHADQIGKAKEQHYSEDEIKILKEEIQEALKNHEKNIDSAVESKSKEVTEL